jgi:hypothetical protein
MSDERNADGSPISSEAQAEVLSPDAEIYSRNGNIQSQNNLSFCRGVEVPASNGQQSPVKPNDANGAGNRPSELVGNMSLGGVNVSVRPVDRRTILGSTPGDSRAKGADAKLPGNPGPRDARGQAHLNSGLDKADNSGN